MRTKLAFAALALVIAQGAAAGTIAIQLSHRAELKDGSLHAALTLTNEGDEAAHSVTPVLRFQGQEVRGEKQEKLPPKQPVELALAVPAAALADGHWPYEIVVEYADANLYPFQALSVGMLAVGSPPLPRVAFLPFESPVLSTQSELPVGVKNLAGDAREVTVRVISPEAIEAQLAEGPTSLPGWGEVQVAVTLVNRTALPGSRYPLFATVEYEEGGVHQTLVGQTTLEIRPADGVVGERGRYLWIGAGVFAALFLVLVGMRLVRR